MRKKILLILSIIHGTNAYCMFKKTELSVPIKRPEYIYVIDNDIDTNSIRASMDMVTSSSLASTCREFPFISLPSKKVRMHSIRPVKNEEIDYSCIEYVVAQLFGYKEVSCIELESRKIVDIDLYRYCESTNNPILGKSAALYYKRSTNSSILHCAIPIEEDQIESIWGDTKHVINHKPSLVPLCYGDIYLFVNLKKEFLNLPKKLLCHLVEHDMKTNSSFNKLRKKLLKYYELISSNKSVAHQYIDNDISTLELLKWEV